MRKERLEWIVNPRLKKNVRDVYLSKLLDLERAGKITLWSEFWYEDSGQFRYKYVITLISPQTK